MIRQPYVHGTEFHKLNREKAKAFIIFEFMEERRHRDDIKRIQADITNIRKIHDIEGLELNALYTLVRGEKQTSGVTEY